MANNKLNAKNILQELKTPGLIIVGMVGGNMAGKAIDKVLKVDPTKTGLNVKAMAKPLIQLTTGVGGAIFLKDQNLKLIASGIAASGVASGVKVFLKKDLLNGLGNVIGMGSEGDEYSQVFREPINLQIEPYNPDLPALEGGREDVPLLEESELDVETIDIEEPDVINGPELSDYTEVEEVSIL